MASRVFCVVIGVEVLLCELFGGIGGRCSYHCVAVSEPEKNRIHYVDVIRHIRWVVYWSFHRASILRGSMTKPIHEKDK
jgi:hypothetical protein